MAALIATMEEAFQFLLHKIGEDPTRGGLKETPSRATDAWKEWFSGYGQDPSAVFKLFEDGAQGVDEMILVTSIPVHSFCEHHIAPFIGHAHIAYIPQNGRILGLSKFARIVEIYARRLQVQERLTTQIADCLEAGLSPIGLGVVVTAKHFCMTTRGVRCPHTWTTTSSLKGSFKQPAVRAEFFSLINGTKDME